MKIYFHIIMNPDTTSQESSSGSSSKMLRSQSMTNISQPTPVKRRQLEQLQENISNTSSELMGRITSLLEKNDKYLTKLNQNDNMMQTYTSKVIDLFDKYREHINKRTLENQDIHKQIATNNIEIQKIPQQFEKLIRSSQSFFRQATSARKLASSLTRGGRTRKRNKRRRPNRRKSRCFL